MKLLAKLLATEPVKQDIALDTGIPIDQDYLDLAARAGFEGAATAVHEAKKVNRTVQLRQFLADNGIGVYPAKSVRRYMDSITPWGYEWGWYPLSSPGYYLPAYDKPIPVPVLMTMALIREKFGMDVMFEVTDIREKSKPDPFLRVRVKSTDTAFII